MKQKQHDDDELHSSARFGDGGCKKGGGHQVVMGVPENRTGEDKMVDVVGRNDERQTHNEKVRNFDVSENCQICVFVQFMFFGPRYM